MERRLPPPVRRALHALWRTIEESDHDHRRGLSKERAHRVVADAVTESADVVSDEETSSSTTGARSTTSATSSVSPNLTTSRRTAKTRATASSFANLGTFISVLCLTG